MTCLETVHREHQPAKGRMQPLDTVRLDVLTNGEKELFASPGDRKFSEVPPISFAGSGVLGDGYFGLYLKTILVTGKASYAYQGEEDIEGRRLARWDYHLPLMWSGQTILLLNGYGKVSLNGSFWADPETLDVMRLAVNAGDFPPSLPLTEARWSVDYASTSMGGSVVLMPASAEFRMATFAGEMSQDQIAFTQCRMFGSQTTIHFDAPNAAEAPARFGASAVDDTLRPLPGGLQIHVKLEQPHCGRRGGRRLDRRRDRDQCGGEARGRDRGGFAGARADPAVGAILGSVPALRGCAGVHGSGVAGNPVPFRCRPGAHRSGARYHTDAVPSGQHGNDRQRRLPGIQSIFLASSFCTDRPHRRDRRR